MDVPQETRLQRQRQARPGFEPGPLAPKARIIPLDQRATGLFSVEADVPRFSLCSMLQSLRHSASAAVKCKKRAQATGLISEKLDFVVPALAWPALAVYFLLKIKNKIR